MYYSRTKLEIKPRTYCKTDGCYCANFDTTINYTVLGISALADDLQSIVDQTDQRGQNKSCQWNECLTA